MNTRRKREVSRSSIALKIEKKENQKKEDFNLPIHLPFNLLSLEPHQCSQLIKKILFWKKINYQRSKKLTNQKKKVHRQVRDREKKLKKRRAFFSKKKCRVRIMIF